MRTVLFSQTKDQCPTRGLWGSYKPDRSLMKSLPCYAPYPTPRLTLIQEVKRQMRVWIFPPLCPFVANRKRNLQSFAAAMYGRTLVFFCNLQQCKHLIVLSFQRLISFSALVSFTSSLGGFPNPLGTSHTLLDAAV